MSTTYAVYVRVSTDKDEQIASVENQMDICRNWLERNGYRWDENQVFKDEGISGTLFLERPSIQLILEKAKRKEIQMVVFKSISRLARDLKDSLEIREVFMAHNVRIISVEEGYDSQKEGKNDMAFELWSLFSAQYSRTLSAGISAALAAKVRRGEHIGKTPFGYDKTDGFLRINEKEATTVRMIYRWYNQGWGYKRIMNELNNRGIKPKLIDKWQVTSVQRLIRNPVYCGDFILNQYTTVKRDGRRKQIRNPPEKWLYFKDHHPAIISRTEWQIANRKDDNVSRRKVTPWNEFRGIAKCSECGCHMVIVQSYRKRVDGSTVHWKYLKCSKWRRGGGCVNHQPITYEAFRSMILNHMQKKGESFPLLLTNQLEKRKQDELFQYRRSLKRWKRRRKRLLELYLDRLIDKEEFEQKRTEVDRQIRAIYDQISILKKKEYREQHMESLREAFECLQEQNQDLYEFMRTLIDEIRVYPDGATEVDYSFEMPVQ
ncbi:recombinase family protein [Melghirimyces algeriensis]|uniref:Site-specific DNA recombinase n=1 Tax=Melghirimyces algeriensis TaxID=910412 RepID=A0A521AP10_9BACL|nr:recombinase family protein [Melghirimyces algeriensis]SMO36555.1 Site-specific DNA recombinase [Melghirimyces algeriensis]